VRSLRSIRAVAVSSFRYTLKMVGEWENRRTEMRRRRRNHNPEDRNWKPHPEDGPPAAAADGRRPTDASRVGRVGFPHAQIRWPGVERRNCYDVMGPGAL